MKNYKVLILNKLIDSYEDSKIFLGKNEKNINIYFKFNMKNIREYFDETDFRYKEAIDTACKQLSEDGFIKIIWGKGYNNHLIEKIQLNLESVDKIYDFLNRKSKLYKDNQLISLITKYIGENKILDCFLQYVSNRINNNQSIKKYLDIDNIEECNDIFKGISNCLKLENETFRRDFSVRVYGDSKRYEYLENKVLKIIRDFDIDGDNNDYNIIGNYTYVYFKGDISFELKNSRINGKDFIGGIAISSIDIDKITNIKVLNKLFTIENLTSFNDFNLDGAVIYLGGFHNKVRGNLLSKIYKNNENIKCYHFGDIDVGGFKILNNLRNKTNIPFIPYKMDVDTLVKYKDYCKELTTNDKKEINKMLSDDRFVEFKDVLEKMISLNIKLEQEIVSNEV